MKKLNGFENWLILTGLELVKENFIKEISEATSKGKNHLFTPQYIEQMIEQTKTNINTLTKKQK
jgi:hypothetical protein